MEKTLKREYALVMMALLVGTFAAGLIMQREDVTDIGKYLTPFVFGFNLAAFGMDALAKQIRMG
jgi:hypothetical protein